MILIDYLIICCLAVLFVSGVTALMNEADRRDKAKGSDNGKSS